MRSADYGEDEPSAQALLARHRDLQGQIRAYEGDVQSLTAAADRLLANGMTSLNLGHQQPDGQSAAAAAAAAAEAAAAAAATAALKAQQDHEDEWVDEIRMVPEEYYEEEPHERTEYRTVTEERLVPQVKGQYAFEGQGMTLAKGEVCC